MAYIQSVTKPCLSISERASWTHCLFPISDTAIESKLPTLLILNTLVHSSQLTLASKISLLPTHFVDYQSVPFLKLHVHYAITLPL